MTETSASNMDIHNSWIQKVMKDLKGAPLSSLDWDLGSIKVDPLVLGKETIPPIHLPNKSRTGSKMPGILLNGTHSTLRSEVLKVLNWGVGSFVVDTTGHSNKEIEESIFKDVDLNMVQVYPGKQKVKISLDNPSSFLEQSANLMVRRRSTNTIVQLVSGAHVYLNICGIRALRICYDQLKRTDPSTSLPTWIGAYQIDSAHDLATGLLRAMPAHLASALAGVDHLMTLGSRDDNESRLHLNNIHLLLLESHIPINDDVICGSYYLDQLTSQLADALWALFLEKNEYQS